ncbi:MAG TPA: hypothetical protein VF519_18920 [Mycobacteriales bacterium]
MSDRFRERAGAVLTWTSFALILYGMQRVFLIGTCGDVGEKPCPPEATTYGLVVVAGLLLTFLALFGFGAWRAFGASFSAVGLAALWAGIQPKDEGGQRWYLAFGLFFLACGLGLLNLRRERDR